MLEQKYNSYDNDLRDTQLSALLREALADDPALAASPGRAEHIMRKILAVGVMPVRRSPRWGALAWASGWLAAATAALALVLTLGPQFAPAGNAPEDAQQSAHAPAQLLTPSVPLPAIPATRNKENQPPEMPWYAQPSDEGQQNALADAAPRTDMPYPRQPSISETAHPVTVASALSETGSTAYATGDYQTAYDAYEASYVAEPTPHALMGSAIALEQLSTQALHETSADHAAGS